MISKVPNILNLIKRNCNFELYSNRSINYQKYRGLTSKTSTKSCITNTVETTAVDLKTVHLLERISLVDLSDKEALISLQNSIQFASQILNIDTSTVNPLLTVLEDQNLKLRVDKVTERGCRKDILQNAKVTEDDYFVAPPGNIQLEQVDKNI